MIDKPGIYDISMAEYLADPCPEPSLTSSAARTLIDESPLHCWHRHPRLGAGESQEATPAMERGSIIHDLVFEEGGSGYQIIEAPDYKKAVAQEARDGARALGLIPVLAKAMPGLRACAAAIRAQMLAIPAVAQCLADGKPERTLVWREGDIWCRIRPDWLPDDPSLPMLNLKTTTASASPEARERDVVSGHAFAGAFYDRGAAKLRGVRPPPTLFVIAEADAPYAVSVLSAGPELDSLAHHDVTRAIRIWSGFMATHGAARPWPGYAPEIAWVDAPAWLSMRQEERKLRDEWHARESVGDQYQRLMAAAEGPIR